MKTLLLAAALALPALHAATASPVPEGGAPATPAPLDAAFQEALLLEEGRRDLPAARRAYEAVVAQVDAQRALAATAVFRLGEVHRKLGQTNEAVAQYRRLLRDFPGEETLARLSRENLAALGAPVPERGGDAPVVEDIRGAPPRQAGAAAAEEIARLEAQLAELEKLSSYNPAALIALQQAFPDAQLERIEAEIFSVEQRLAALRASLSDEHPDVRGAMEQLELLRHRLDLRWQAVLEAQRLRLRALKAAQAAAPGSPASADTAALAAQVNDFRRRSPLEPGALAEFLAAFPDAELERLGRQLRDAEGRLNALGGRTDDNAADHDSAQSAASAAQAALRSRWQAVLDAQALRAEAGAGPGGGSALEAAEIARLTQLIAQSPDLLDASAGEPPQTPLQRAAAQGQLAVVQFLLARGADVNRRGQFNSTALLSAARAGHKAVVEALLDAGADPNVLGDGPYTIVPFLHISPHTPLIAAAGQGFTTVVETLLARGADPNLARGNGGTALMAAVGFPPTVEILLNRGAVVTQARQGRTTALHLAVAEGHLASVERLLKAGAEVNAVSDGSGLRSRGTPLAVALAQSQVSRPLVETLIRAGAVVGEPPGDQNPLTLALGKGDPALLELVLTAKPTNGFPAGLLDDVLVRAVVGGMADAVAPLLRAGASPEAISPRHGGSATVLLLAAERADAAATAALLAAKPDVNRANDAGWTALHYAAHNGATNVIRLLLDAGADPNRLNQEGQAPLNLVLARLREEPAAASGRGPRAIGARPSTAPTAADWWTAEALLRAAGAREDLPRRQWILLRRGPHEEQSFRRAGDDPPPRLADVMATGFRFDWPDLSSLRLHRLAADGPAEVEMAVPPDWPARPDCDWNIPLAWGDALEVPEADHPQGAAWTGLGEAEVKALQRCTARTVILVVKEQRAELSLLPAGLWPGVPRVPRPAGPPGSAAIGSCRLGEVVKSSRLLRSSSDLTRVEVTRATGQTWTLDVANDPRAQQFWLLDGDRIVVPEARP